MSGRCWWHTWSPRGGAGAELKRYVPSQEPHNLGCRVRSRSQARRVPPRLGSFVPMLRGRLGNPGAALESDLSTKDLGRTQPKSPLLLSRNHTCWLLGLVTALRAQTQQTRHGGPGPPSKPPRANRNSKSANRCRSPWPQKTCKGTKGSEPVSSAPSILCGVSRALWGVERPPCPHPRDAGSPPHCDKHRRPQTSPSVPWGQNLPRQDPPRLWDSTDPPGDYVP